jgi:hypothetical protein
MNNNKTILDKFSSDNLEINLSAQLYYNFKLPITFNPKDYGTIIQETKINKGIKFIIAHTNKSLIIIDQIKEDTQFNLVKYYKNNKLILD